MKQVAFSEHVCNAVKNYLEDMSGHEPVKLHELIISETEKNLITMVLSYMKNNKSKTAKILGISRVTLDKKLALYGIH
ncbi:MAG TPA: helix-turn-helix domain-containing protein [Gammaproteobacteria bacterium]|nr:helix-turn-helix domain-containing protein [Gammaproteobacteria bacterium]